MADIIEKMIYARAAGATHMQTNQVERHSNLKFQKGFCPPQYDDSTKVPAPCYNDSHLCYTG